MGDVLDGVAMGVAIAACVFGLLALILLFPMVGQALMCVILAALIGITIWRGWLWIKRRPSTSTERDS